MSDLSPLSRANRGFTLIELLVVIIIISISFSLTVFSLNSSGSGKKIEEEIKRFKILIDLTKEKTLFENVDIGLYFYRKGYGFVIPVRVNDPNTPDDPNKMITQFYDASIELADNTFRKRELPKNIELSLTVSNEDIPIPDEWPVDIDDDPLVAHTMFFSSGESSPFSLSIHINDEFTQTLNVNELGEVIVSENEYEN